MKQPNITIIINEKTYSLCASDVEAIRSIPNADRQQLITLLEVMKQQERLTQASIQQTANRVQTSSQPTATVSSLGNTLGQKDFRPEHLGSGDVDGLMAQLIVEEKRNEKPGLTIQSVYKWVGGITAFVILLILVL